VLLALLLALAGAAAARALVGGSVQPVTPLEIPAENISPIVPASDPAPAEGAAPGTRPAPSAPDLRTAAPAEPTGIRPAQTAVPHATVPVGPATTAAPGHDLPVIAPEPGMPGYSQPPTHE
jgi:hypothetical protein